MMTGFRQPVRIQWIKYDGTIYRIDSIAYDRDPDQYAKEIRRIEGHNYEYVILRD